MTARVAAIQMVSGAAVAINLARASSLIAEAAGQGAELVVLPEAFATFGDRAAVAHTAEREADSGNLRQWLAAQAQQHKVVLVGGTIPVASDDGRAWAACLVFDASVGDETGRYCESRDYRPGAQPLVVDTALGRLGLAVCFDLRFAAQFQWLQAQGADMIAVPSAFTRRTGLAHWLPLLRARAIETQCLIIGANQGGEHSATRKTSGGSAVVDAWGEVLVEAGFGEAALTANWDKARQLMIREQIPMVGRSRFSVAWDS